MNCFRYLGFTSFAEVDQLTVDEYALLMKAAALREADAEYYAHLQAWLNVKAGAKKKAGKNKEKLVYARFDKFYDRKKVVDKIMNPTRTEDRFEGIGKLLKRGGGEDGRKLHSPSNTNSKG